MRKILFLTVLVVVALGIAGATALATGGGGGKRFSTNLTGFQEVPAISTAASGRFVATLDDDELSYELSYSGIEGGTAVFAHIHFGQRSVNGGVRRVPLRRRRQAALSRHGGDRDRRHRLG